MKRNLMILLYIAGQEEANGKVMLLNVEILEEEPNI
jgi:hypothetical protein